MLLINRCDLYYFFVLFYVVIPWFLVCYWWIFRLFIWVQPCTCKYYTVCVKFAIFYFIKITNHPGYNARITILVLVVVVTSIIFLRLSLQHPDYNCMVSLYIYIYIYISIDRLSEYRDYQWVICSHWYNLYEIQLSQKSWSILFHSLVHHWHPWMNVSKWRNNCSSWNALPSL